MVDKKLPYFTNCKKCNVSLMITTNNHKKYEHRDFICNKCTGDGKW